MAALSKKELLDLFNSFIGDNNSDDALAMLEAINDTIDSYESKTQDITDWEKKYQENDAAWRKKYKDRFSQPVEEETQSSKEVPALYEEEMEPLSYEGLFKTN